MMLSRRVRRFALWTAVIALLTMQVAVAAHACPYAAAVPAGDAAMAADCAGGVNRADQPNLCKAHGDVQSQIKGDQVSAAMAVPAAITITVLSALVPAADASRAARSDSYSLARLAPDGSPPIFVRHRVFRK